MSVITVVGIGPGDPDLLTLTARDVIQDAEVVAAFESVLAPIRRWLRGEVRPMRYADQDRVLDEKRTQIVEAAKKYGKTCAMLVGSPEQARRWRDAGVLLVNYSSEGNVLMDGYKSALAEIRS